MNLLGKLFKRKKTYSGNCDFKLCIVNDDTDSLYETLGITEQRAQELCDTCLKAYADHKEITSSYQDILKECAHINEVVMCCEMFQKIRIMKQKQHSLGNMIDNLFGHGR